MGSQGCGGSWRGLDVSCFILNEPLPSQIKLWADDDVDELDQGVSHFPSRSSKLTRRIRRIEEDARFTEYIVLVHRTRGIDSIEVSKAKPLEDSG